MSDHLPSQMIELFVARKLAPADLLAAARHLALCESCRAQSNRLRHTNSGIEHLHATLRNEWQEQTHLSYEQLAAFVDASLSPSDHHTVSLHLADCAACANHMQELAVLKNSLADEADSLSQSAAANPASVVAEDSRFEAKPTATIRRSPVQVLVDFLQRRPMQTAFATAVILLAALLAGLYLLRPAQPPQMVQSGDSRNANSSSDADGAPNPSLGQANQNVATAPPTPDSSAHGNAQLSKGTPPAGPDNANRRIEIPASLDENANLSSLPPGYKTLVKQTLANQAVRRPAIIAELAGRTSNLMSKREQGEVFALINPVATVTPDEQPTFRWQALDGATAYTVYVLDLNYSVILKSPPLSTTVWRTPQALRRGSVYAWQVTASKGGIEITSPSAPMPEARFKILEQAKSAELQRLAGERADSHLILGAIYAHNGLLDEAEREFQLAIEKNLDVERAKKLLQSVKAMR